MLRHASKTYSLDLRQFRPDAVDADQVDDEEEK
jgi:hypothetical protein